LYFGTENSFSTPIEPSTACFNTTGAVAEWLRRLTRNQCKCLIHDPLLHNSRSPSLSSGVTRVGSVCFSLPTPQLLVSIAHRHQQSPAGFALSSDISFFALAGFALRCCRGFPFALARVALRPPLGRSFAPAGAALRRLLELSFCSGPHRTPARSPRLLCPACGALLLLWLASPSSRFSCWCRGAGAGQVSQSSAGHGLGLRPSVPPAPRAPPPSPLHKPTGGVAMSSCTCACPDIPSLPAPTLPGSSSWFSSPVPQDVVLNGAASRAAPPRSADAAGGLLQRSAVLGLAVVPAVVLDRRVHKLGVVVQR
jgi:hypothetical protein